jgi:hypothetical protein
MPVPVDDRLLREELAGPQVAVASTPPRAARVPMDVLSTLRVPMWIAAAYVLLTSNADPDLFGHLRFGLDHLGSGHLWSADPYSFTSDQPWINHEWLSELTMALAYSVAGVVGLAVLKCLVTLAALLVIRNAVKNTPPLWRWPSGLLAVLGTLPVFLTIRPQIWTLLFLMLTCTILTGPWRRRYWLPAIFLLWANMHGGWLVGMGVLGVWCGLELLGRAGDRPPLSVVVIVPTACLLATLINPYGWHLWEFLARTVSLTRADITEWQPLWRGPAGSAIHWVAAVIWAGFAIRYAQTRSLKAIATGALLAYSSMRVLRLVPLFIPAVVILLIPYVKHAGAGAQPRRVSPRGKMLIDLAFACVGFALVTWPPSPTCVHMKGDSWVADSEAARAISTADLRGRMVTWFDWGEYAIWHFGPQLRVSVDGRRETVYSEHAMEEQRKIAYGDPAALARLQAMAPEYAWLPQGNTDRAKPWFASHGYRIDVSTPRSFLAVREDLPRVPPVAAGPAPCFPGL